MIVEFILFLLLAGAVVAVLSWSAIESWINGKSTVSTEFAEIIRTKLKSGDYKVVAGVFSGSNSRTADKTWQAKSLDSELESKFKKQNSFRINL